MKTFELAGKITFDVGSCHDDRLIEVEEEIQAFDNDEAIMKARGIAKQLDKKYNAQTDYQFILELKEKGLTIWKIHSKEIGREPETGSFFRYKYDLVEKNTPHGS